MNAATAVVKGAKALIRSGVTHVGHCLDSFAMSADLYGIATIYTPGDPKYLYRYVYCILYIPYRRRNIRTESCNSTFVNSRRSNLLEGERGKGLRSLGRVFEVFSARV